MTNKTNNFNNMTLITGGDPTLEIEILEAFLLTSQGDINLLRTSNASDNAEEWRRAAHSMKGGCYNLGADILGELCQEAQKLAKEPKMLRDQLLASIETEFVQLEVIINTMIKSRLAHIQTQSKT